jgi:hypothetical protein
LEQTALRWIVCLAKSFQQIGHEPRQAFVLLGGGDPGASGKIVRKGDGHVPHYTNIVFPCFRVNVPQRPKSAGRR